MIVGIDKPENKERIAIIVIGYNRIKGLSRLLDSINNANYDSSDIPLVISIDASGNQDLYHFVENYEWAHGDKYVNIQKQRLGLKDHIFQCFSLTKYFKGVILLEDDIYVAPYFYHYANCALNTYGDEKHVAGIALYTNEYGGFSRIPLQFVHNGYDAFAWQDCCTWGEMMNERMWNEFSSWMKNFDDNFASSEISDNIKKWDKAWSKYMYAYMLDKDTYFVFPYESVTTNFNDAGGEHGGGDDVVQVSLLQGKRNYQFCDFPQLEKYDMACNNVDIPRWLGVDPKQLTIDFTGGKKHTRYVLSDLRLPYKKIKGYKLTMKPWELNIKFNLEGDDMFLYDRESEVPVISKKIGYSFDYLLYYFRRYIIHMRPKFIIKLYWRTFKDKFRK